MNKPLAMIRRESLAVMSRMDSHDKANIRNRIFKNHEISKAKASHFSRLATRQVDKATFQLARADSIVRHIKEDEQAVEERMK